MNITERDVQNAKAEYARQWRAKNPEKNKEYIRRYWERKAAQAKAAEKEAEHG